MARFRVPFLLLLLVLLACESQEDRLGEHQERGDTFLKEEKWAEAELEFKTALSVDPNSAAAHYGLALAFLGSKDPRRAYWELEETVRLDPNHVEARLRHGEFLLFGKKEELTRAVESADAVLALEPKRWEALLLKARAFAALGQAEEAGAVYQAAVEAAPDQPLPLLLLANHLRATGKKAEAEASFTRLTELHPAVGSWTALAAFLAGEGRDAEAEAAFRKAIEIAKPEERTAAWSALASFLIAKERTADAEAVLKSALADEPGNLELIYALARFYHAAGRTAEADGMIEEATRAKPDDPAPLLLLSSYRGRIGDLPGALEAADRALKAAPDDALAKLRRAEVLIDMGFREKDDGRIAQGKAVVDAVLAKEDGKPEGLFVLAKVDLAQQRYDDAIAALRRAVDARPDWSQAQYLLGTALFFSGDAAGARSAIVRSIELDPNAVDGYKMLLRVHAKLGDHRLAVEAGERALAREPDDIATRIQVAQSLVQDRRFDEALGRLLAIPEEKRGAEGNFAIGRVYAFREEWANARKHLGLALEAMPGNSEVLNALVQVDAREGKLADSYARIRAARDANPGDARLQILFGEISAAGRNADDAEDAFRKAIEIDPNALAAYTNLAGLFVMTGRVAEAISTYERALEQSPKSGSLHLLLGSLLEAGGRLEDAMGHYSTAIEIDPELAIAKNNLAYLMAERGKDLDRALDLAQEAKAKLPDNPNAADTLGWVLYKKNVPAAAIGYLREAVGGLRPDDPSLPLVRHHLALAYEANEEPAQAIEVLEQAVTELDALRTGADGRERPEAPWAQDIRDQLGRLKSADATTGGAGR
jgi:tetratricopeptide (TPR) repeat protein